MFKTIKSKLPRDIDLPQRAYDLAVLTSIIEGCFYDHLPYSFVDEYNQAGEYIILSQRRPSVKYGLCRIVVDDSVSLLFSEGHFPSVVCKDEKTRDALAKIIKEAKLNEVMITAATWGSVGSVAIQMRVLGNRVFFCAHKTVYLTPTWKADAPDTLEKVTEKYKVKGEDLKASGYTINDDELKVDFWFQREWNEQEETWFVPWKVTKDKDETARVRDAKKSTEHKLGFVPMVWVRNMPGGDDVDGACTFTLAIDDNIEIDYQLSQAGRGLKYSADPTLVIKEPATADGESGDIVKGGGNALVVDKDGDAKLLEIAGTASDAVINYVKCLREMALETIHGNRSNADKLSAAQSGRAMELMNQSLIWLADRLRISYGEGALLDLLNMIVLASKQFKLVNKRGIAYGDLADSEEISLRWPPWYAPTYADKQTEADTLGSLTGAKLLSRETATATIAKSYDIDDPDDEKRKIEAEPPIEPPPTAASKLKKQPPEQSDD